MDLMDSAAKSKQPFDPLRAWLAEFFLNRNLYAGPTGKPLYSYQVSSDDFAKLRELLRVNRSLALHPVHSEYWARGFCLFVAECYRREYDASGSGWSWKGFEQNLDCSFSVSQRIELVKAGLERYWKRPIRQRPSGRDWLGSLFLEGGLPWLLVQSETHGFGRAVRRGLKNFYRTEGGRHTTADLMAESESDLPQTFRNLDTRQLLAGIVEQLMYLAAHHPLREQADPAAYLDAAVPGWPSDFPIPLDESNARGLINEWLRDAGQRRQERREAMELAQAFTCEHRLGGSLPTWHINTDLLLPSEETFQIDPSRLGSTRLELAFFEGERLLARGGVVYGQLNGDSLKVRYPRTQVTLERMRLREPVSLRLLDNGRPVHVVEINNSTFDLDDVPLVFERREEQWCLAAMASCSVSADIVWIRLPPDVICKLNGTCELAREEDGAIWIECKEDLNIRKGDNVYNIILNSASDASFRPMLTGHIALFDSNPGTVFLGWPKLEFPDESPYRADELVALANRERVLISNKKTTAGIIRYSLRTQDGTTLLQRRFGVLPEGFGVSMLPSFKDQPARLVVRNGQGLNLRIISQQVTANQMESEQGVLFHLNCRNQVIPSGFQLAVCSRSQDEPVLLNLNYPYQGARLIGADDLPRSNNELMIDELLGMRIVLTSAVSSGQDFHLQLELSCIGNLRLRRNYVVRVGDAPLILSLFSYQNDILQMLGVVDTQDAYVRLTLETDHRLLSVNVRRYNGMLKRERSRYVMVDMNGQSILADAKVEVMLLCDPKREPLQLQERTSEGVGTGVFESVAAMESNGPWLIYPSKDSAIRFRPELYVPTGFCVEPVDEVCSLHKATQLYHPFNNPLVIDEQVSAMANDLEHSGWQYLDDLKQNFGHLPLSSFESWRSLSHNYEALATAILRLEIDEVFAGRIRDELAVIWECISLPIWVASFRKFRDWLAEKGWPDALISSLQNNRRTVLQMMVSGFDHLGDYLATGDRRQLVRIPPIEYVLPDCYQELRRNHESDQNWPTDLGPELARWVDAQNLPPKIKQLSNIKFTDAVTYLPVFMAYVTSGRGPASALPVSLPYLKFSIRKLSDFDRHSWYVYAHAVMVCYLLSLPDQP